MNKWYFIGNLMKTHCYNLIINEKCVKFVCWYCGKGKVRNNNKKWKENNGQSPQKANCKKKVSDSERQDRCSKAKYTTATTKQRTDTQVGGVVGHQ